MTAARIPLLDFTRRLVRMGIDWMTYDEIAEAVPPDYTEFIGQQLLVHVRQEVAA